MVSAAVDARPVVDRDALAERLFLMFRTALYGTRLPERWDGIYRDEKRRWLRYADSILAAGVVQDADDVRRQVAEEIAAAIEADADAEVERLGGWSRVHSNGELNNWVYGIREAAQDARATAAAAHPRSP